MRHEVAYADQCLSAWASWVRSNQSAWPRRTLLGKIMDEGASGASQGMPIDNMPYQILQTDRAVAKLPDRLRKTIKVYYLTHASSEVKAAALHVTRHIFLGMVASAQSAVFYRLNSFQETPYSQAPLQIASF